MKLQDLHKIIIRKICHLRHSIHLTFFMKIFLLLFLVLMFLLNIGYSFDLCPACSPEVISSEDGVIGYMLGKGKFSCISLYRFGKESAVEHHGEFERALVAFNYGLTNRFKVGLMYGFTSQNLSLQVDYLILQEKNIKPGLILGSGSFRGIFSESHPYIVAVKSLEKQIKLPIRISAGIKHKGDDFSKLQLEPVGNLIFNIYRSLHLMSIFEGTQVDLAMYGVMFNKIIVGVRMIELKLPAIGIVLRM